MASASTSMQHNESNTRENTVQTAPFRVQRLTRAHAAGDSIRELQCGAINATSNRNKMNRLIHRGEASARPHALAAGPVFTRIVFVSVARGLHFYSIRL